MKLRFRGDSSLVEEALGHKAELRVSLLLGRFGDELEEVTCRLSTTPGTKGRSEKRCEIVVLLRPEALRVEHRDVDLEVALDRAADKAVRSIGRALDREREQAALRSSK
jgi:putative sigma-54 modulation protein